MSALGKRTYEGETKQSVPKRIKKTKAKGAVYTFAGVVENHAGMEKIGTERDALSEEDLVKIAGFAEENGFDIKYFVLRNASKLKKKFRKINSGEDLSSKIFKMNSDEDLSYKIFNKGCVLIIRDGVRLFGTSGKRLLKELKGVKPDTKFYNSRRKIVQNKNARHNFNVADFDQEPQYEKGMGTVVDFKHLPQLSKVRKGLTNLGIPKCENLLAEANVYHSDDSGIGFHGDSERRMVIGANMGEKRVIEWQSFLNTLPIGKRVTVTLRSGDMYFMDEDACGHHWSKSGYRTPHYRHRAGYPTWLNRDERTNQKKWAKRRAKMAKKMDDE